MRLARGWDQDIGNARKYSGDAQGRSGCYSEVSDRGGSKHHSDDDAKHLSVDEIAHTADERVPSVGQQFRRLIPVDAKRESETGKQRPESDQIAEYHQAGRC